MSIRNKLTLLFSLIFAGILFLFAITIFVSYEKDRQDDFFKQLKRQAITKVNLLLVTKVKPEVLQLIYKSASSYEISEEIGVFDSNFNLIYHDAADEDFIVESQELINEIIRKKEIRFVINRHQAIGFTIVNEGKTYVVTAVAYDEFGFEKLENLIYTLIITFCLSMILVIACGRYFAKQALRPVTEMVDRVEEITATNLDLRVNEGSGKDEISELAITFNQMLNRLEKSFDAYKEFVSNIAHEIRTPLAAIITELELSENKERSIAEYKKVINDSLSDARKLAKLSSSLLDLAKASYDPAKISFKEFRIDELLLDAQEQLQKLHNNCNINIHFEKEFEHDRDISVRGNEYLLKVAFVNLMENACKFSADKQCQIVISFADNKIILKFIDNGIGISPTDLNNIFIPFFRGNNKSYSDGHGIGLSLTEKIINLHNGRISVISEINKGTTFEMELPQL
ncbi:HAMP domain-containing sensor histidine kinase [Adhaeribacter aquaticus]|uniref:HAMP domain-containing sensor histidine kinase n=1 Tax=Adhaeribacter aquaticus TaxID=299567 RepID=UPI00040FAC34|nr:HAMP domain-containing sensor histidine kinase [Adhaeribacter aquaticus]